MVAYMYYTDNYGGIEVPEDRFKWAEQKAVIYLDNFTFGRLKDAVIDDIVKNCICDMSEVIYRFEKQGSEQVKKSENTDGYSVSYVTELADGQDRQDAMRKKLYGIAECYLMNTGLLSFEL